MANYEARFRTNNFRVKNKEQFEKFIDTLIGTDSEIQLDTNKDQYTLYGYTSIPSEIYDAHKDTYTGIDFYAEMRKYLADGEVMIIQEIGNEKLRYFTGLAVAMDNKGKEIVINIDDINRKAMKKWKKVNIPIPEY
jgi:hypothetical protein